MRFRLYRWFVVLGLMLASSAIGRSVETPIAPAAYVKLMGKGLDVDWSKTRKGRATYSVNAVEAFRKLGLSNVRIRIKDDADAALLRGLDAQVNDCLAHGLIPIIAYQADAFKKNPNTANELKAVTWWRTVAEHYRNYSPLLSFDILIEATDSLNREPGKLNDLYAKVVPVIRQTNPTRIIFISPRLRSAPEHLSELKIPATANGYLMAEWHFYAAGPSRNNPVKQWTTGTGAERKLIADKIHAALEWEKKHGIYTWVGAWMPGDLNKGGGYTVPEEIDFAAFVASALNRAGIPYSINAGSKFYDYSRNRWIQTMLPVLNAAIGKTESE